MIYYCLVSTVLTRDANITGNHQQENAMSSDNLSNQSCNLTSATGDTAPLKSQFDHYGLLAESNANVPPQNCGISGSAPGQAEVYSSGKQLPPTTKVPIKY